jgi:hypothetical protein
MFQNQAWKKHSGVSDLTNNRSGGMNRPEELIKIKKAVLERILKENP